MQRARVRGKFTPPCYSKFLLIRACGSTLPKDHKQEPILTALEDSFDTRIVELIVPRTVVDEFGRNKARVIEESCRSLSGTLKRAK